MPKLTKAARSNVSLGTEMLTALDDHSTNARRTFDTAEAARLADALRVKPGQRSWKTRANLATGDGLIREAARSYPGSNNAQAEAICRDLSRYESTTWKRTRGDAECRHPDPRRRAFWQILRVRGRAPSKRTIDRILAGRS